MYWEYATITLEKKLLQEKGLDLQRCVDICRASEKSNYQLRVIEEVQFVKKSTKTMDSRDKQEIICEYCGFRHRKEKNHFARICVLKRPQRSRRSRDLARSHIQRNQYTS